MKIANKDTFGVEELPHDVAIRRQIMVGDPIPPGLVVDEADVIDADELGVDMDALRRRSPSERLALLAARGGKDAA